jgi:cell wall hydrolase
MILTALGIVTALAMGASAAASDANAATSEWVPPSTPHIYWLPTSIAVVEPGPSGAAQAWKLWYDPVLVRAPIVRGASDRRVAQLQRHLTDLGVFRGEIDGVFGREVAAAVVAVHKLADIERTDTWVVSDWDLELDHSAILSRHPGELDRLEVDIDRQVLFIIRSGEIAAIMPVSTGNGAVYWSKNSGYVRARTPRGNFRIFKHVNGWRTNYLGTLYKPWYFTPYYAVHGSSSVPPHPASHGCVRVPNWEANHLDSLMKIGLPIHIWDEPYEPPAPEPEPEPPREPPDGLV